MFVPIVLSGGFCVLFAASAEKLLSQDASQLDSIAELHVEVASLHEFKAESDSSIASCQ